MTAKRKPMSQKEKKQLARFRAEMRAKGILPPKKQPLNRKQFAKDVMADWHGVEDMHQLYAIDVPEAIAAVLACCDKVGVTPEQVGVLKVLRIAIDARTYKNKAWKNGKAITVGEYYDDVIAPILKL